MSEPPDFGPRGYLPERAAKRARKIVLREQMSAGWVAAAVAAAALVALAGFAYLRTSARPPGPPFTPLASLDVVAPATAEVVPAPDGEDRFLVLRGGGAVRVFAPPDAPEVQWCPDSNRLEAADGRVWTAAGRLVGGDGDSLRPRRSIVFNGRIYVDVTTDVQPTPPDPRGEEPACAGVR